MTKPTVPVKPGEIYGRLTVIEGLIRTGKYIKARVRCTCGTEKLVYQNYLQDGRTKSCGCLSVEMLRERSITHGMGSHPMYAVWHAMVARCINPGNKQYEDYGGRGIKVAKRWLKFENFLADMGEPPPGLSLERRNNDRGYSKGNCYWATRTEQSRNKRNSVKLRYKGKLRPLAEIAEMAGMTYGQLYQRLYTYNWTFERAIQP